MLNMKKTFSNLCDSPQKPRETKKLENNHTQHIRPKIHS